MGRSRNVPKYSKLVEKACEIVVPKEAANGKEFATRVCEKPVYLLMTHAEGVVWSRKQ